MVLEMVIEGLFFGELEFIVVFWKIGRGEVLFILDDFEDELKDFIV